MQESLLMLGAELKSGAELGELVDGVRFWGEVPTSGFINGSELASAIGLTVGTAQHTNEPWLHFELDGKTLYVAKKPYRHSVSWDHLDARRAALGTTTVVINGLTYKVRLLKGADASLTRITSGWNPAGTENSEWNRLIYSVHNGVHTHSSNTTPPGAWPLYSDIDLVVYNTGGSGSYSWCQEANFNNRSQRVVRGGVGVSYFSFYAPYTTTSGIGWRPVLELVP